MHGVLTPAAHYPWITIDSRTSFGCSACRIARRCEGQTRPGGPFDEYADVALRPGGQARRVFALRRRQCPRNRDTLTRTRPPPDSARLPAALGLVPELE